MNFIEDFIGFVESHGFRFERTGEHFYFPDKDITIVLQPLKIHTVQPINSSANSYSSKSVIFLYQDRWYNEGDALRKRICARMGVFTPIFARKCIIEKISSIECNAFMEKYHSYGKARCKYCYALRYKGEIVAAASFSAPRPMQREINGQSKVLQSYEWVRYSSLPEVRVCGGMGKLLNAFIDEVHPDEIMSYCDKEWSEGEAYFKLGFRKVGEKPPMKFYVNRETYERISLQKVQRDKAFRGMQLSEEHYITIYNQGSIKFLKYTK